MERGWWAPHMRGLPPPSQPARSARRLFNQSAATSQGQDTDGLLHGVNRVTSQVNR